MWVVLMEKRSIILSEPTAEMNCAVKTTWCFHPPVVSAHFLLFAYFLKLTEYMMTYIKACDLNITQASTEEMKTLSSLFWLNCLSRWAQLHNSGGWKWVFSFANFLENVFQICATNLTTDLSKQKWAKSYTVIHARITCAVTAKAVSQ